MDPGSGAFLFCSSDDSICARLRENDEQFTDLQLWLNASSDVPRLTDALWDNTSIQFVTLLIHESFADQEEEPVLSLFSVLGHLPQLTKLFFNTYRFPFVATLPVQAFTNVFQGSHQLVEFKLWRTDLCWSHLDGHDEQHKVMSLSQEELQNCAAALATCVQLQEFKLIKCRLSEHNLLDTVTPTLDPILKALARLPSLQVVELNATKLGALGTVSPSAVASLMQSTSLKNLSLSNFDLSEETVLVIAESLLPPYEPHPHSNCYHQRETTHSRRSKRILSQLASSDAATLNATNKIASNLRHLRLSGVGSTVSMFRKPIRGAFRQVLESNFLLESIFLFDSRNLQQEIALYLKLNRFGRQRLLLHSVGNGCHEIWMDALIQVRDDLDCLFYLLSINPLLCSNSSSSATRRDQSGAPGKHQPQL